MTSSHSNAQHANTWQDLVLLTRIHTTPMRLVFTNAGVHKTLSTIPHTHALSVPDTCVLHAQKQHTKQVWHLIYLNHENTPAAQNTQRLSITIDPHVHITLLESYVGTESDVYQHATHTDITLEEHAALEHVILVQQSDRATSQIETHVHVRTHANYKRTHLSYLGKEETSHTHVYLESPHSQCALSGVVLGYNDQIRTHNTHVHHKAAHTTSHQLYKNIASNHARVSYAGVIDIEQHAPKTQAYQYAHNLILHKSAHAHAEPHLKILTDDVICKHGATVGKINHDALFYLRSRGLSEKEAMGMLVSAFAAEPLAHITDSHMLHYAQETLTTLLQHVFDPKETSR